MGLVRYDRYQATSTIDELSNPAITRILIVNDADHLALHQQLFVPLIQEISDRGASGVGAVLELQKPNIPRGQVVDRIRNDSDLAQTWSTFDDVGSFEARVGLLLGLDRLPLIGHYGTFQLQRSDTRGEACRSYSPRKQSSGLHSSNRDSSLTDSSTSSRCWLLMTDQSMAQAKSQREQGHEPCR